MWNKIKNCKYIYELYLIFASVFWAVAFIWIKQAMNSGLLAQQIIFIRYSVAVVIMLPFCFKELMRATKTDLLYGFIGGALLGFGMLAQTVGLGMTTPSNSAFITTTYVVMVPFVAWAVDKKPPKLKVYICAIMALIGLYVLTRVPGESFSLEPSVIPVLLSAVIFSFQVVFVTYAGRKMSVKMLTFLPILVVSISAFLFLTATHGLNFAIPNLKSAVFNVSLTAIFATVIAGVFQVIGQKKVEPSRAAILMSLESVFTCIVSVIMGYDSLSLSLVAGGLIIVCAIIISELK